MISELFRYFKHWGEYQNVKPTKIELTRVADVGLKCRFADILQVKIITEDEARTYMIHLEDKDQMSLSSSIRITPNDSELETHVEWRRMVYTDQGLDALICSKYKEYQFRKYGENPPTEYLDDNLISIVETCDDESGALMTCYYLDKTITIKDGQVIDTVYFKNKFSKYIDVFSNYNKPIHNLLKSYNGLEFKDDTLIIDYNLGDLYPTSDTGVFKQNYLTLKCNLKYKSVAEILNESIDRRKLDLTLFYLSNNSIRTLDTTLEKMIAHSSTSDMPTIIYKALQEEPLSSNTNIVGNIPHEFDEQIFQTVEFKLSKGGKLESALFKGENCSLEYNLNINYMHNPTQHSEPNTTTDDEQEYPTRTNMSPIPVTGSRLSSLLK